MKLYQFVLAFPCSFLLSALWVQADVEDEIVLGQTAALEGPAAALGQGMKLGMNAFFSHINAEGGLLGKQVRLISLDDGYEPERTIENAHRLIDEDKVFCLIGSVGTPTSSAILSLVKKEQIPLVGAFTGAGLLREPYDPLIVNLRASYEQEVERIVEYLHGEKGYTRISILYQNDSYGIAGLSAMKKAMERRNLEILAKASYERNTTAVKRAVLRVRKLDSEAVVMVGAYQACAKFIEVAKQVGLEDVVFCNISFVGTEALATELGEYGEGTLVSQVVPDPLQSTLPVVVEYRERLKKLVPTEEPNWVSLEGYLVAKLFAEIYLSVKGEVNREKFVLEAQGLEEFDLGGVQIKFGPQDNQGMDSIYLTVFKNNQIKSL